MPEGTENKSSKDPDEKETTPWLGEAWKDLLEGRKDIGPVLKEGVKQSKGCFRQMADDFRQVFGKKEHSGSGDRDEESLWKGAFSEPIKRSKSAYKQWTPKAKKALNTFGEKGEAWTERTADRMRRAADWVSKKTKGLLGGPKDRSGKKG